MPQHNGRAGSTRNSRASGIQRTHRLRRRKRGTIAIIDDLLLRTVSATLNGEAQQVRTIDAIMLQLLEKALSGSERAWRALMKFEAFAERRVKRDLRIEFVESEYTRSFSRSRDA